MDATHLPKYFAVFTWDLLKVLLQWIEAVSDVLLISVPAFSVLEQI